MQVKQSMQLRALILGIVLLTVAAGCNTDDIGEACVAGSTSVGMEPVGGEEPLVGVVRIERDGQCESFQCLRHMGIEPYCTRSCELGESSSGIACTEDAVCAEGESCVDEICSDDDCPDGFWCREVQGAGPLAGQLFCARRTGCEENSDCESIGEIDCVDHYCFDACFFDEECGFPQLDCTPVSDVQLLATCGCTSLQDPCPVGEFKCSTDTTSIEVGQQSICITRPTE